MANRFNGSMGKGAAQQVKELKRAEAEARNDSYRERMGLKVVEAPAVVEETPVEPAPVKTKKQRPEGGPEARKQRKSRSAS